MTEGSGAALAHIRQGSQRWLPLVAMALGAGVCLGRFGFGICDPTSEWMVGTQELLRDSAHHYAGWIAFRAEPWSLNPAHIHSIHAPVGTTISLTDSIPIAALVFKTLDSILPPGFHYFGWWILMTHCLQGLFAYLLLRELRCPAFGALLCSLFFVFDPPFLHKAWVHAGLQSFWIVLWSIWTYVRAGRTRPLELIGIAVLATFIHPYLAAMSIPILLATIFRACRLERAWATRQGLLTTGVIFATVLSAAAMLSEGAGIELTKLGKSMDLASAIVGREFDAGARLLGWQTKAEITPGGYAYFGLGGMLLLGVIPWLLLRARAANRQTLKWLGPLSLILVGMLVFSLLPEVRFAGREIVTFTLPEPLATLRGVFRAAHRFAHPLRWGLLALSIMLVFARMKPRRAMAFLLACLSLQFFDILPRLSDDRRVFATLYGLKERSHLTSPDWERAAQHFDRLVPVPLFSKTLVRRADSISFSLLAIRNGKSFGGGWTSRQPVGEGPRRELRLGLETGKLSDRYLYIFGTGAYENYATALADQYSCPMLDGYRICFARKSGFTLSKDLAR